MLCLNHESTDPCFNLAAEEFLLKNSNEEYLFVSINDTSVITGKHQIAHRESNTEYVIKHNIPVIRRISGGGTVFHDRGNLNFSFIFNAEEGKQIDFRKYTLPVIEFLASVGINAKFEGKNDLKVGGYKISGNAEHVFRKRVLHHGTLLFDADLDAMKNTLRSDPGNYFTRAVRSNPSAVVNIRPMLEKKFDIIEFRSVMLEWFLNNYPRISAGRLSDEEEEKINQLAESKYRTWEWNYGYGPDYCFTSSLNYLGTGSRCKLFVSGGKIKGVDTEGHPVLKQAFMNLSGCRHMPGDIRDILVKEGLSMPEFNIYCLF